MSAPSYHERLAALRAGRARYVPCSLAAIPADVTFHVPGANGGQIVEYAYGAIGRSEHDEGDPWMRVVDRSVSPEPRYYRLEVAQ